MTEPKKIIKNFTRLKSARSNWDTYWQRLHDYFYIESDDVNTQYAPGQELTITQLWDSASLEAADVLGSGLLNYLTPPTSKWFALRTPDPTQMESKDVMVFLKDLEAEVYHALNRSNFYNQKPEFYKSSGVYGTSVLLEEEDLQDDIRFYNLPIKQVCINEDARGRVIEFYIELEYTADQVVSRFGEEALTNEMRRGLQRGLSPETKYKYLLYIGPRHGYDMRKQDNQNMKYKAVWIDIAQQKTLQEGGYNEMPAFAHRFYKRSGIVWGFSPAMKCLPDVRVLNAIAKTQLRAAMKLTDPPVAMPDNAFLLPLNANPRGINYYDRSKMTAKELFPFGNYGNVGIGLTEMEYRVQRIRSQMFNDVFMAFQGITKQMTVPEVMERITEKMTLLGPAVGRFISDVLDKIITRTIGILARADKLPPVPDALIENPQYEIEYVSALAKAQKSSELQSLQQALVMVGQMAQFDPQVLDKVNTDKATDVVWGITAAPVQILRDDQEVGEIRENRAEAQAAQQRIEMLGAGAEIADKAASANLKSKEAQSV